MKDCKVMHLGNGQLMVQGDTYKDCFISLFNYVDRLYKIKAMYKELQIGNPNVIGGKVTYEYYTFINGDKYFDFKSKYFVNEAKRTAKNNSDQAVVKYYVEKVTEFTPEIVEKWAEPLSETVNDYVYDENICGQMKRIMYAAHISNVYKIEITNNILSTKLKGTEYVMNDPFNDKTKYITATMITL